MLTPRDRTTLYLWLLAWTVAAIASRGTLPFGLLAFGLGTPILLLIIDAMTNLNRSHDD